MMKPATLIFALFFIVFGFAGFFSNPVTGPDGALFAAGAAHNIFYVLTGVGLFWGMAKNPKLVLKAVAAVYLALSMIGFVVGTNSKLLGIMVINQADNWLNLVLAIVLFILSMQDTPAVPGK